MRFYIASEDEILNGKITDIYFLRTKKIIEAKGLKEVKVRMEVHLLDLPENYQWVVYAGLEEALHLLKGKPIDVYSLPEGTLIKENTPVMIVEGRYYDICEFETPLLGILRHYTSVATKAARFKKLALNKTVLYFGLRSAHPAIHPMLDRAAYIGGVDGVSGSFNKETLGVPPMGTMPHALILVFDDEVDAWKAFDEVVEPEVPRIALIDTYNDERFATVKAVNALGKRIHGVRIDTPRSRRGDIKAIVEEIKWTLKLIGRDDVKIYVSGGLNEEKVKELRELVDGFGIGTSVTFPPSVDLSMDIVEKLVNGSWIPHTKKGKWPGAKKVWRCGTLDYEITPFNFNPIRCKEDLMIKWLENGKIVRELPSVREIREYVLKQLREAPEP
ncbi:MAG: nicotinate phosphoribosyltransferase [Zestosphaera tikiterensis]|uniref:nicotinate phosphoribosyltransferase n=1 Tax=Zestosphaera tikiterensis TaxID=1973259 RepID=A0A2R7Y7B0_9CREN|nr:MAG: nicotinate phosphoribosyltransferase [Zestosphaera tikiterensis]